MYPPDPWGLVAGGECQDRRLAYFTICITGAEAVLTNCLASICALLATTDPSCVIALVSRWVYRNFHNLFVQNGVLPVQAPEWPPLHERHPHSHLQGRGYTFSKLEAFRLTQYTRVVTFDIDVLFMRNASGLGWVEPFAASRTRKGKNPDLYVNTGVMVLSPSQHTYAELVAMWRSGNYSLYFSDEENTEQDVIIELCVVRGRCGPVADLDACIFNHGVWLPGQFSRRCRRRAVVARHNFLATREAFLAGSLQTAMYRGTCRARAALGPHGGGACWHGEYTRARCCSRDFAWGDSQCWGAGLTYERCCMGVNDAERLQRELLYAGRSSYGLSSQPEPLPQAFMEKLCVHKYRPLRRTLAGMSSLMTMPPGTLWYPRSQWEELGPPPWFLAWGAKCKGLRAPHLREEVGAVVVFSFKMLSYFARFPHHPVVANLHASFLADHRFQMLTDTVIACVPHECCWHQPTGVNSSLSGLHKVLWNFLTEFMLSLRVTETVPPAEPGDFEEIYEIDPAQPTSRWQLCYRS